MNNIIKRGLGALQSLITKGFGGAPVVVESGTGSVKRLFPRRFVKKVLTFNVNGLLAVKKYLNKKIKGILVFFEKALYNIVGRAKILEKTAYLVKATTKFIVDKISYLLKAKTKHVGKYSYTFPDKYKVKYSKNIRVTSVSAFYRLTKRGLKGKSSFKVNSNIDFSGYRLDKIKKHKELAITGKIDLTKVLMAVGLLKGK